MAFDFKKEYKEFYMPKNKPSIVEIPRMNYIAVRGTGNPNEENGDYQNTCKAMMGEFLLYYNNVLFGGIYDNRLLVKIVDTNKKYNMQEQIPYESAKPMYLVDDVDNKDLLKEIVIETCKGLPNKK